MAGPYDRFRSDTYAGLLRRIERGERPSDKQLADALIRDRGKRIPVKIVDYLAARLRGNIERRGRRPGGPTIRLRDELALLLHESYFAWLKERKQRMGLAGWSCIRETDWWEGPPNERAARMTVRHLRRYRFPACDWRHVLNLVSSRKKPRN